MTWIKDPGYSFDEYGAAVLPFAVYSGKDTAAGLSYTALGLTGEAGEVADKVKKLLRDGGVTMETPCEDIPADTRVAVVKELGDVLWYVTAMAQELGFSLEDVARMNRDKLTDRAARDRIHGDGDNR